MSELKRRKFDENFKVELVQQYLNGQPKAEIIKAHNLSYKVFNEWLKKYTPQLNYNYQEVNAKFKQYETTIEKLQQELDVYKTAFLKLTELNK